MTILLTNYAYTNVTSLKDGFGEAGFTEGYPLQSMLLPK